MKRLQAWWHTPIVSTFRRLRQDDCLAFTSAWASTRPGLHSKVQVRPSLKPTSQMEENEKRCVHKKAPREEVRMSDDRRGAGAAHQVTLSATEAFRGTSGAPYPFLLKPLLPEFQFRVPGIPQLGLRQPSKVLAQ